MKSSPEVLIIGGGPSGTTAGALLAQKGRDVLILDKAAFPRYHIGESLIPYTYFTLERLGMIPKMKASHFTKKYSIQFVSQNGKVSQPFYFFSHFDHDASQTWQVLRSEFDQMMIDNAKEKGAKVRHGVTAKELIVENGKIVGAKAIDENGKPCEFRATVTIDASGRDAISISQFDWRVPDKKLDRFAVWTYFKGAVRDPGLEAGATTVAYVPDKGWFWYIPLANDITSIGIVAKKDYLFRDTQDLAEIYKRETQTNKWIEAHIASATQIDKHYVTNEFSYRAKHCASDGLVLVGDAFNFLDPVFSSGVFFALRSGELAADAIDAALTKGDVSAASFAAYGERYCSGIEAMRKLVHAFYEEGVNFGHFIRKYPDLKADLTDCIIGAVEKDYKPLFEAFAEFATIPAPVPHGTPFSSKALDKSGAR